MTRLAEVKAERDREHRRADLLLTALNLVLRDKPDGVERVHDDDGCTYIYKAYGLTRADGGIIVQQFVCKATGQADSFDACYFDDLVPACHAHVVEQVRVLLYRLLHADTQADHALA